MNRIFKLNRLIEYLDVVVPMPLGANKKEGFQRVGAKRLASMLSAYSFKLSI
jgi:hypothetical protein